MRIGPRGKKKSCEALLEMCKEEDACDSAEAPQDVGAPGGSLDAEPSAEKVAGTPHPA